VLLIAIPNSILVIMNHSESGCGRDFSRREIGVRGSGEPRQAGITAMTEKHGAKTSRGVRLWRIVHQRRAFPQEEVGG